MIKSIFCQYSTWICWCFRAWILNSQLILIHGVCQKGWCYIWQDVWDSGWRISANRWCFNPVCGLSTSHPPSLHLSLAPDVLSRVALFFPQEKKKESSPLPSWPTQRPWMKKALEEGGYILCCLWPLISPLDKINKRQRLNVRASRFDSRESRLFNSLSDKQRQPQAPASPDPHFGVKTRLLFFIFLDQVMGTNGGWLEICSCNSCE